MPRIGRRLYQEAMEKIFSHVGYNYRSLDLGNILVQKNDRILYVNVAGKNLPYPGGSFPWETHVSPGRLDEIIVNSSEYEAEPWIAFCYCIFENQYRKYFFPIISLKQKIFGAKLITVKAFKENMHPRSPSWGKVDLHREEVVSVTLDPLNI